LFCFKQWSKQREMLLWTNHKGEGLEAHVNAPANHVPSFAKVAEFLGLRASVAIGYSETRPLDA
jgi:hypothetical protein